MAEALEKVLNILEHPKPISPVHFVAIHPPTQDSPHAVLHHWERVGGLKYLTDTQQEKCCSKRCLQQFTYCEVLPISNLVSQLTPVFCEQLEEIINRSKQLKATDLHSHLQLSLRDSEVEDASLPHCHAIKHKLFVLKVLKHYVCPEAFARLWGSSLSTLERIVDQMYGASPPPLEFGAPHFNEQSIHFDSYKQRVCRWLDARAAEGHSDHKGHLIIAYNSRKAAIDDALHHSEGYDLEDCNPATFEEYWSSERKNIKPRDERERCKTCTGFDDELHLHPDRKEQIDKQRAAHKADTEAQREQSRRWEKEAQDNPGSVISVCCDSHYASAIKLPKRDRTVAKEDSLIHVELQIGGYHDDGFKKPHYFVHHHQWSETSNAIITSLFRLLQKLRTEYHKKLYLSMDNHSTNKSNVMLAFLSHLVQIGWFDVIELLFFVAYEGKSRSDQEHSVVDKLIKHYNIFSPEDFVSILTKASRDCTWLRDVRDWEVFYKPFMVDFPDVSLPHQ